MRCGYRPRMSDVVLLTPTYLALSPFAPISISDLSNCASFTSAFFSEMVSLPMWPHGAGLTFSPSIRRCADGRYKLEGSFPETSATAVIPLLGGLFYFFALSPRGSRFCFLVSPGAHVDVTLIQSSPAAHLFPRAIPPGRVSHPPTAKI